MALLRSATEVISGALTVAVSAKLTMPMRLPEPMESGAPPVDSAKISTKALAPSFKFARGLPAILPERSRIRTISVGLEMISGAADRPRVTWRVPSQSIRSTSVRLVELVMPMKKILLLRIG